MSLLTPDIGLLFWMLLSFGFVFLILAKFGFPIIVKMVEERREYIENSLKGAKEANEKLAGIQAEGEKILSDAREEQMRMLKEVAEIREKMIKEAKQQAGIEADKVVADAKAIINKEKEQAIQDIRKQVVELSVNIAEKVMRKSLDNRPAQIELIDKLLDEAQIN